MRLFSLVVTNYTLSSLLCIKIWYGIKVMMSSVVTGCMYVRNFCASDNQRSFVADLVSVLYLYEGYCCVHNEGCTGVVLTPLDKQ